MRRIVTLLALLCAPAFGFAQSLPSPLVATPTLPSQAANKAYVDKGATRTVNVLDKGALMDCVTDDTAAFQAAINAVQAIGGIVDVPPGCAIIAGLTINSTHGTSLRGQGPNTSILKAKTATTTIIGANGPYIDIGGFSFVAASGTQTGGAYVVLNNSPVSNLHNFEMLNGWNPIVIRSGFAVNVYQGSIRATAAGSTVISVDGGNDQFLYNLVVDNDALAQPANGIFVVSSGAIWIRDVDFIHSGNGLVLAPPAGKNITWIFVQDSAFDTGSGCGIMLSPAAGAFINGSNFTNTWTGSNQKGVCTAGGGTIDGVSFNHHRSFLNNAEGFLFLNGVNIVLDGNTQVSGNSAAEPGVRNGVEFGSNVSGWSVRNSHIGAGNGFPPSHANNIAVDAGVTNDAQIMNNDLRGAIGKPFNSASSGSNRIIGGNLGYPTIVKGGAAVTAGATSIAVLHGLPPTAAILPGTIVVTPTANALGAQFWVSAITTTSFTVTLSVATAADFTFNWRIDTTDF